VLIADLGGFLSNVAAAAVAGLIVLAVAYWFVETKLSLRERAERAHENEEQRHRTREAVLRTVHEELESNAAQLTNAFTVLPARLQPNGDGERTERRPTRSDPGSHGDALRDGSRVGPDKQTAGELYAAFKTQRARRRDELLDRLQDLKEHLNAAIDAVEPELGLDLPNRAGDPSLRVGASAGVLAVPTPSRAVWRSNAKRFLHPALSNL